MTQTTDRLRAVHLDGDSIGIGTPDQEHERQIAVYDLVEENAFSLPCESYYAAIRTQTAAQIEAIDMGRRGLHNEGADLLIERLAGKITCDKDTARRLFTLITALHWKG